MLLFGSTSIKFISRRMKFTACVSSNTAITVSIREHGMQSLHHCNQWRFKGILLLLNENIDGEKENDARPLGMILKIGTFKLKLGL